MNILCTDAYLLGVCRKVLQIRIILPRSKFCKYWENFNRADYKQCSNGTGTHWNAVPFFFRPERRSGPLKTTRLIVKLHQFRGTCSGHGLVVSVTKFVGLGDASASLNKESHVHCVI